MFIFSAVDGVACAILLSNFLLVRILVPVEEDLDRSWEHFGVDEVIRVKAVASDGDSEGGVVIVGPRCAPGLGFSYLLITLQNVQFNLFCCSFYVAAGDE